MHGQPVTACIAQVGRRCQQHARTAALKRGLTITSFVFNAEAVLSFLAYVECAVCYIERLRCISCRSCLFVVSSPGMRCVLQRKVALWG